MYPSGQTGTTNADGQAPQPIPNDYLTFWLNLNPTKIAQKHIMYFSPIFSILYFVHIFRHGEGDFWPKATSNKTVSATIAVSAGATFDCKYVRYIADPSKLGNGNQAERQKAIFKLGDKATLANCIIGAAKGTYGAADGVHCNGSCTVKNCWWEDVGEDAVTFYGLYEKATYLVDGGGAKWAADKIFQHDGMGTATIRNFWALNFTRLYRSCGNCAKQYERHVVLQNITAINGTAGQFIAGVNSNYGDSAKLSAITIGGVTPKKVYPCKRFIGVTSGSAKSSGSGPDGTYCIYSKSDITYA